MRLSTHPSWAAADHIAEEPDGESLDEKLAAEEPEVVPQATDAGVAMDQIDPEDHGTSRGQVSGTRRTATRSTQSSSDLAPGLAGLQHHHRSGIDSYLRRRGHRLALLGRGGVGRVNHRDSCRAEFFWRQGEFDGLVVGVEAQHK